MSKVQGQARWINWAGNESSHPSSVLSPESNESVQSAILQALETGQTIKAIGASHSFSAIGATDGVRMNLDKMQGLVSVDASKDRVTVWAGTHLWQLPAILDPLGLALPNMGDIDAQTVAGATQTGTHGTGLGFGGLATFIVGVTIVTGLGEVIAVDESDPELLSAVALSLGALGIITTITLQCVPRFLLCAEEAPAQLEDVLNNFLEISKSSDHFEFYWFPHTKKVRTKLNTRLAGNEQLKPLSKLSRLVDEEFVNNDLLGAVLAIEHRFSKIVPRTNRAISLVSSKRTYTDWSRNVFVTKRRVRFKESEFALPIEAVPDVLRELDRMIERKGMRISFPLEVRSAKADSLMMSTAHARDTGYIAMHRYHKDDEREYFKAAWQIMRAYEGRPHWGKMHDFTDLDLEIAYEKFDHFLKVRDTLDPERVFANDYLKQTLGD